MIPSSTLIALPVMALLTILQTTALPYFPIFGVIPSFPFLVAITWGLLRGVQEGMIWAFIAGIFMDLFTAAPAGGLALSYTIAIFAILQIKEVLPENRILIPVGLTAIATVIQWILHTIFLAIFGYNTVFTLTNTLLPVLLLQSFLILPIYWLFLVIHRAIWPKAVEV